MSNRKSTGTLSDSGETLSSDKPLGDVVVVGAGPIGCSVAALVARTGKAQSVKVFERQAKSHCNPSVTGPSVQTDEDGIRKQNSRSYSMRLSPRGTRTLTSIGVDINDSDFFVILSGAFFREVGVKSRNPQFVKDTKGEARITSRMGLTNVTFDAALAVGVQFSFQHSAQALDVANRKVCFRRLDEGQIDPDNSLCFVSYDLLIACDGVYSFVRDELSRLGFISCTQIAEDAAYKSVSLPPSRYMKGREKFDVDENTWDKAIHFWSGPRTNPFEYFSILSAPDLLVQGTDLYQDLSVTRLYLRQRKEKSYRPGVVVFSGSADKQLLATEDNVAKFFIQNHPDIVDAWEEYDRETNQEPGTCLRHFSAETCSRQWNTDIRSVFCSKLAHDNIVLIGDAGSAMSPSFGQGAVCGLESAYLLIEALKAANFDIQKGLNAFSSGRLKDVRDCVRLSREFAQYRPFRHREVRFAMLLRAIGRMFLPFLVEPLDLFRDLQDPAVPYSTVYAKVRNSILALRFFWLICGVLLFKGFAAIFC